MNQAVIVRAAKSAADNSTVYIMRKKEYEYRLFENT